LHLLPGKLDVLAKNLCKGIGGKGSIAYDEVSLENLLIKKKEYIEYMKNDIYLLGEVVQKAQELYWKNYKIDIECKVTLSSVALTIFRMKYYDVNSLYPYVMHDFPMPGGEPEWHGNLGDKDLDSLFGFIEAYVECPETRKRPFLPFRDKKRGLIFPTGSFFGVYYSEELKYARDIGYTVIPLSGYLFQKKESPFKDYVSTLYNSRLKAKKEGNDALAFLYKNLLNSLYGRFGIHPKSTITLICDDNKYNIFMKKDSFIDGHKLKENNWVLWYHNNMEEGEDRWDPPQNSAVYLAAAITASARIYMYPFISREDCYYTDTDSVVLGSPLPPELISGTILGKFKLEERVEKGMFVAPKTYYLKTVDEHNVIKFKGPAKTMIHPEWFEKQYADPSLKTLVEVKSNFKVKLSTLEVTSTKNSYILRLSLDPKRVRLFETESGAWADTMPLHINDLSGLDHMGKRRIASLRNKISELQVYNSILEEKFFQKGSEVENKEDGDILNNLEIETCLTEDRTILDREEKREGTNHTLEESTKTDEKKPDT